VELISADGYSTQVTLAEARKGNVFLAYEWEGKALPELHGYPVRAVFPGSLGYNWVKWLVEIKIW
jgi:DMSO/TMAO reductase YedYZ molybdopterin-dependent catalytic subunit